MASFFTSLGHLLDCFPPNAVCKDVSNALDITGGSNGGTTEPLQLVTVFAFRSTHTTCA